MKFFHIRALCFGVGALLFAIVACSPSKKSGATDKKEKAEEHADEKKSEEKKSGGKKSAEAEKPDEEKSRVEKNEKGETVVKLDDDDQKRLGIETGPLAAAASRPQIAAFGHVVDPSALAALDSDLTTAEAALASSKAEAGRLENLFKTGENVAKKTLEAAEAQFRTDDSKVQALRRRLAIEWGESIAKLGSAGLHAFLGELIRGKAAFIRVDVPAAEFLASDPTAARVLVLGREAQPLEAASVAPATSIDPKTQAQGFLLQIEAPPFPLRPGSAVTAYLEMAGEEQHGVVIPRNAIVRHAGGTWVYVEAGDNEFTRRAAELTRPVQDGWFVASGFEPKEKVVTAGAQAILSEELKAQFAGGSD
jgi:hypothetical protein